jgi:hypothetical protein
MNKAAGEEIGDMIGEVLKVDADENDLAFGDDEEERMMWCPLSYEFFATNVVSVILIGLVT